jgi:hypothetical protein
MSIIWLVLWSPGASRHPDRGNSQGQGSDTNDAGKTSPRTHSFSASTTAASTTMAARFISPTTTNSARLPAWISRSWRTC